MGLTVNKSILFAGRLTGNWIESAWLPTRAGTSSSGALNRRREHTAVE